METWKSRQVGAADVRRMMHTLHEWALVGGYGGELLPGDVGWMLRHGVEQTAASLVEFIDESGITGAIFCNQGGGLWVCAASPGTTFNRGLAESVAVWADALEADGPLSIDGPYPPAFWRPALAMRGFEGTTDTWAHLWRPLGVADVIDVAGVEATQTDRAIADRVAVQRAAFDGSTFTVEKWHAMSEGAIFRPQFDLLARNNEGEPVAAVTAWYTGAGACALIEPMGTHRNHRRQGHGQRVLRAVCAALARDGAESVYVVTPDFNTAAVELYRAAGFRRIGSLQAMVREGTLVKE